MKYIHVPQLNFCRTVQNRIENNVAARKNYDEISQNRTLINYIIFVTRQTNSQEYKNDFHSQMKSEDRRFNIQKQKSKYTIKK